MLTPPNSFPAFPYPTPYNIQLDFMKNLYECIEHRKVGIFESPTGTGKSLSMICGALGWLMDHEKREQELEEQKAEEQNSDNNATNADDAGKDDLPDWVRQHARDTEIRQLKQEREDRKILKERVQRIREREQQTRENIERKKKRAAMQGHQLIGNSGFQSYGGSSKKKKNDLHQDEDSDDAEYLLEEYHSDQESKKSRRRPRSDSTEDLSNLSEEVRQLLQSFDEKEAALKPRKSHVVEDEDEDPGVLKIYYCSRTHSQLSQFIDELRKTSYVDHLHVVALGSRKTLCINDKMRNMAKARSGNAHHQCSQSEYSLGDNHRPIMSLDQQYAINVSKLNDLCLDAQKSGTPSDRRCQFLHRPSSSLDIGGSDKSSINPFKSFHFDGGSSQMDGDEKVLEFRDHTMARIRDIEELAELGKELETCPYYGARQTAKHCELVTLPYNLLLHASTRESLKLTIKDNVLLLDEAHNLIDSLLQMHSVTLSLDQLRLAQEQLVVYLARYETRLSATNEGYVRVLIRILKCLETFVQRWMSGKLTLSSTSAPAPVVPSGGAPVDRVMKVNEFLHEAAMDHINLYKAHTYLQKSGVARKLQGLHESIQRQQERKERRQQQQGQQQKQRTTGGQVKIHSRTEQALHKTNASGATPKTATQSTTPILLTVDSFLMSLLNADNDGRVIITMEDVQAPSIRNEDEDGDQDATQSSSLTNGTATKKPVLKFMLLNPANVFRPLVEEARSVILAGGTMEPVSDLLSHLFPYLKEKVEVPQDRIANTGSLSGQGLAFPRIHRFSCGHVIPKDNLLVLVTECSSSGMPLELNFANRNQDQVMDAVGQSLVNLLGMIPDGVVVFFVSYSYMNQVIARWKVAPKASNNAHPPPPCIFDRIQAKKKVFIEPKEASEADQMLREYSDCIHASSSTASSPTVPFSTSFKPQPNSAPTGQAARNKGAVLFSVVGGKMSEGINFSDRLGRGVIMVGMPYPNKNSPELQERMRYMDYVQAQEAGVPSPAQSSASSVGGGNAGGRKRMTAGSEYYENLCMRAVNQSIGRAIRHRNDYAVIVLLDRRYGHPRIQRKLPGWIGNSLERCEGFGQVV
ncbi:DEAD H (Asp-Glu-Ala-Asp His) box helicase 11, partial [Actinomortierella wolfii]